MKSGIRMVVFDMDGVLADVESSWRFVHAAFGVDSGDNMKRYLTGEIDYNEFMKRDIRLWGAIKIDAIRSILSEVPLMDGAEEAVRVLKRTGYRTAIVSAGISILANRIQDELGIDFAFANELMVTEEGVLTGEGREVVNLRNKVLALRKLALRESMTPRNCAVIGDSVFDISLFKEAGLSIAFNPGDGEVGQSADFVVENKDLTRILPYLIHP